MGERRVGRGRTKGPWMEGVGEGWGKEERGLGKGRGWGRGGGEISYEVGRGGRREGVIQPRSLLGWGRGRGILGGR